MVWQPFATEEWKVGIALHLPYQQPTVGNTSRSVHIQEFLKEIYLGQWF